MGLRKGFCLSCFFLVCIVCLRVDNRLREFALFTLLLLLLLLRKSSCSTKLRALNMQCSKICILCCVCLREFRMKQVSAAVFPALTAVCK